MTKRIEILMDNGGGLQLQTAKYAHSYESDKMAEQCAEDIREFLRSGDTSDWEGNEPHCRRDATQSDDTLDRTEIEAIIIAGRAIARVGHGHTAKDLVIALLGDKACDYIERAVSR